MSSLSLIKLPAGSFGGQGRRNFTTCERDAKIVRNGYFLTLPQARPTRSNRECQAGADGDP